MSTSPTRGRTSTRRSVNFVDSSSDDAVNASQAWKLLFNRRSTPAPARTESFSLGELEGDRGTGVAPRTLLRAFDDEGTLKDEIHKIFSREKDAMETHYLTKIQDLLKGFKSKKLEWEDLVKAERNDLENHYETERNELQQHFASEIAKMTRSFHEEKLAMEKEFDVEMKRKQDEFENEKKILEAGWQLQMDVLKKQNQAEYESKLAAEIKAESLRFREELEAREKKWKSEREELERKFRLEKDELANKQATAMREAEVKFEKIKSELEGNFKNEKLALERDWQQKLRDLEDVLRKEKSSRLDLEQAITRDKVYHESMVNMLKDEIARLKKDLSDKKQQTSIPVEIKVNDVKSSDPSANISLSSRADLPGKLREEFDHLLKEYKGNLKDKFDRDRTALEQKMDKEFEKLKEKTRREKEDFERKVLEDKVRHERDIDKSRDDIEKEIERRYRTKQLQESLSAQQAKFDEVAKKLEHQEQLRRDGLRSEEVRRYELLMEELRRENDGLKAKVQALEDRNKILKNLKDEGQEEVERLRKAVEDLKSTIEAKKEREVVTTFRMEEDPFADEKLRLRELRSDLQRQDQELKDRKMMEDIAKKAAENAQDKYEELVREKRKLESALTLLENRVAIMQEEVGRLRMGQQSQAVNPSQPPPPPLSFQPVPSPSFVSPMGPMYGQSPAFVYPQPTFEAYPPKPNPNAELVSPKDEENKIATLLATKERLSRQLEEYQTSLKEARAESSELKRQLREHERQIEKLEDAWHREREVSMDLRDALSDEKVRVKKLRDELDKEIDEVSRIRKDSENVKERMQREISELQSRLFRVAPTIYAIQSDGLDEKPRRLKYRSSSITSLVPNTEPIRMASLSKAEALGNYFTTSEKTDDFKALSYEELEKIKLVEKEKVDLERKLVDTKNAFEKYTEKLSDELKSLETRLQSADKSNSELATKNVMLNATVESLEGEKRVQARQNGKLVQQKHQLQKLIERLTSIKS